MPIKPEEKAVTGFFSELDDLKMQLAEHGLELIIRPMSRTPKKGTEKKDWGNYPATRPVKRETENASGPKIMKTRVKEKRTAMGLSVPQLAYDIGTQRTIVYRMEDDSYSKCSGSLQPFADFFKCTIEDLIVRENDE